MEYLILCILICSSQGTLSDKNTLCFGLLKSDSYAKKVNLFFSVYVFCEADVKFYIQPCHVAEHWCGRSPKAS